jgi:hypothetical protein
VDLRRLRSFDVLAGLFGAALVGLLWAPWYHAFGRGLHGDFFFNRDRPPLGNWNAWQAMAVNDVILCVAGLLGVWLVVATVVYSTGAVPIAATSATIFVGLLASVLCMVRLIWPPDLGPGPTDRAAGVWLGTAAAIALTVCAVRSLRDERRLETAHVPVTELPAPRVEGGGA